MHSHPERLSLAPNRRYTGDRRSPSPAGRITSDARVILAVPPGGYAEMITRVSLALVAVAVARDVTDGDQGSWPVQCTVGSELHFTQARSGSPDAGRAACQAPTARPAAARGHRRQVGDASQLPKDLADPGFGQPRSPPPSALAPTTGPRGAPPTGTAPGSAGFRYGAAGGPGACP
jgi:hypothetical protein